VDTIEQGKTGRVSQLADVMRIVPIAMSGGRRNVCAVNGIDGRLAEYSSVINEVQLDFHYHIIHSWFLKCLFQLQQICGSDNIPSGQPCRIYATGKFSSER